ncbi:MAG: outer membrane protein assembly factor BamE [Caulobacteraceae bacterium]
MTLRRTRALAVMAALAATLVVTEGCAPVGAYEGFQAIETQPGDIKVGEDTRTTVQTKLGSPTQVSTFDTNTWFYISQIKTTTAFLRPRVVRRDVVAIAFDASEQVTSVNTYSLADGRVIAINGRETPTRGREMSVIEQLLGSIGQGGVIPQTDDATPGSRPDDRR